jgi:hypothetical protein
MHIYIDTHEAVELELRNCPSLEVSAVKPISRLYELELTGVKDTSIKNLYISGTYVPSDSYYFNNLWRLCDSVLS